LLQSDIFVLISERLAKLSIKMKTSTNILCLFLAVLALAQHVKGSERLVGEYS